MGEAGFDQEKITQGLQAFNLLYAIDVRITDASFPDYAQSFETLVIYFVKGLFT